MARKSSKQANVQQIAMMFSGGLNYSQSRSNIADNELTRARNFIYDPETDYLITRPGTVCQTAATCDGANPILKGYYYEKSTTVAYHVAACNGNLYYLSGASLDGWTSIGALTDTTTVPSFLTFNNKLLIADGGADIRTWDGTTYTTIASSPQATILSMIRNRVVANATDELDSVYLSKTNDETGWDTTTTAVGLKAGYGDSLAVNGFAVFGDDLIVSKKGDKEKRIYRVNVASATTSNWYVQDLSQNNATQHAHSILSAWNNVFFIDSNGFKSVRGTETYGDLAVDPLGRRINTIFPIVPNCDFATYIPSYNAIWFNVGERVFCYTERNDPQSGGNIPAFTDLYFNWGKCTSIYQAGSTVYLTGNNGYLYKLDETKSTDETAPDVTSSYTSTVRGKTFSFFGDGILRKLQFYLSPKAAGAGIISVCTEENTTTTLETITLPNEGQYLYDATGYLADATGYLYDTGASPWVETSRNRIRNDEMAFQVQLTSGRCGVEWGKAEIALVEGGD